MGLNLNWTSARLQTAMVGVRIAPDPPWPLLWTGLLRKGDIAEGSRFDSGRGPGFCSCNSIGREYRPAKAEVCLFEPGRER